MTQKRLYELALRELLEIWSREKELLKEIPDNSVQQERERRAYKEYEDCHAEAFALGLI